MGGLEGDKRWVGENMNWFIVTSKRGIKNVIKNAVTNRNEERIKKKKRNETDETVLLYDL